MTITNGPADGLGFDQQPCSTCGRLIPRGAEFCPWCGTHAAVHVRPAPVSEPGPRPKRGARIALIAVAAVTAVALVATAAWVFLMPKEADRQLASATTALQAAASTLSTAGSTAEIRSAGAAADSPAGTAQAFLNGIAQEKRPTELVAVSGALSAIASLKDISGETATAWDSAENALRSASGASLSAEGLNSSLTAAADNAEKVIGAAVTQFQAWQAENAAAIAARDEAIAGAQRYQSQMQGSIDDYIDLRKDLSSYITRVDESGSTVDEAYLVFSKASSARREVRDDMSSLNPPAAVSAAHGRLLSVISDGIAGVESAERALDVAYCDWIVCYVQDEPAWWNFRDESKRITAALDEAITNWQAASAQAVADAEATPLPAKPAV